MTGWFLLLGIALATLLLIWAFGMPRRFWMAPLAALMLGAAGYALQGSPDSPGRQVTPARPDRGSSAAFVELRQAMFGRFTHGDRYLTSADGLLRRGRPGLAITVLLSGISESPRDPALWTGLGIAYAAHDNRVLSPAALLAFDRALALAPRHPGPYFFRGLAHARAAEFESARQWLSLIHI